MSLSFILLVLLSDQIKQFPPLYAFEAFEKSYPALSFPG